MGLELISDPDFEIIQALVPGHDWVTHDPLEAFDNFDEEDEIIKGSCVVHALLKCALDPSQILLMELVRGLEPLNQHVTMDHFLAADPSSRRITHGVTQGPMTTSLEDYRIFPKQRQLYLDTTARRLINNCLDMVEQDASASRLAVEGMAIEEGQPSALIKVVHLEPKAVLTKVHPGATLEDLAAEARRRAEDLKNTKQVV